MTGLETLAVSEPLSYLAAFLLPALDVIVPVLPSETVVIALGVATAGSTDPRIVILVGLAALGAFAGDNTAYWLGRRFGPTAERRLFSGERGKRRLDWARRTLDRFGARLIIVCRFIPGGRTAVTLTCGIVGYPRRAFVAATAVAAAIWASYAYLIGRLGGSAFQDRPWLGLAVALGAALLISVLVEMVRRVAGWRRQRLAGERAFPPFIRPAPSIVAAPPQLAVTASGARADARRETPPGEAGNVSR